MEVEKVIVFVEFEDGQIRQVKATKEQKFDCLELLKKDGLLQVLDEVLPIQADEKTI